MSFCYSGYFKLSSFEHVNYGEYERLHVSLGFQFIDEAYILDVSNPEYFKVKEIFTFYEVFSDCIPSIKANEGRCIQWQHNEFGYINVSFHKIEREYYLLFEITQTTLSFLSHSLGGTPELLDFFYKLYDALGAQCFMLGTNLNVYQEDMVKEDINKYYDIRLKFLAGVMLAINPSDVDEKIFNSDSSFHFRTGRHGGIVYYERFTG